MTSEKYKPTYILIALNVILYIVGAISGGNALETSNSVILEWGQVNAAVLLTGAYWQLVTSMFIHASIFHLVGNMLFLLIFGLRGEGMFSLPEYLGIYLVGGLVGNVLSLGLGIAPGGVLFVSVGASGAIFAMFGACVIYGRRAVRQSILSALVFAFFLFVINSGEGVNILAHFGGLAFGLIIGYILASRRKPHQEDTDKQFQYRTMPF